tara:strand:- start:3012 stop:3491 length:480 start_codon:yes stop_codon:yes gene_type:complete
MKINKDDCFPNVEFFVLGDGGPKTISSSKLFDQKKILLVGVPGAFTPTCSNDHLPGFLKNYDEFRKRGIDEIFFVSVNDPFVMTEWGKSFGNNKINFISDCNYEFLKKSGLELDLSSIGLGKRLSRFAMVIDNGLISNLFDENGGGLEISKAENILSNL